VTRWDHTRVRGVTDDDWLMLGGGDERHRCHTAVRRRQAEHPARPSSNPPAHRRDQLPQVTPRQPADVRVQGV
jgi:hypothetical protein